MILYYLRRKFLPQISASETCLILSVIALIKIKSVHAYGEGAPPRICKTMLPNHGEQSLNFGAVPFDISLDKRYIRGTGKITIKVVSKNPSKYSLRGVLFIMKQTNKPDKAFGTFDPRRSGQDLKTIACFGKPDSGITHTHREPKTMLMFEWNAPNDTNAEYELHATLVRDFNSFWADYIFPEKIRVNANAPASAETTCLSLTLIFGAATVLIINVLYISV